MDDTGDDERRRDRRNGAPPAPLRQVASGIRAWSERLRALDELMRQLEKEEEEEDEHSDG